MTRFFFKFLFLAYFLNFWSKSFFQKLWLCHTRLQGFQHHAKIQRNIIIQFQENNQTDGRMEGQTDPISQDPSSYHQGSNKYNCSRLAFKIKVEDIEYDFGLTKNYCITVSIQKSAQFIHSFLRYSRFQGLMN